MGALIVDDEPFARTALEKLLSTRTDVAHNSVTNNELDLVFRRTATEKLSGLAEILRQIDIPCKHTARIALKVNRRIIFIDPNDVVFVRAEGNYVLLQRTVGSNLLRESISVMADKLKPYGFIRIHRSVLVNRSFIEEVHPRPTGEYALFLKGGHEETVTRTYKENLRHIAAFWIGTEGFS